MWQGILGHDELVEQFRRTLRAGRLASTYLFVGPAGVGKRKFALGLAQSLLCTVRNEEDLNPCGECESCRLFASGAHPDLDIVGLKPDKSELAISQFVGYDDDLKQEGLCHRIGLKPFFGRRRVAIVDDADHFNVHSANCLLKTLEEPPPQSLLILIGTSPSRQLPTIRSRSQIVRFQGLSAEVIEQILVENGLADQKQARAAAQLADGSVESAVKLMYPALGDFREQLLKQLQSLRSDSVGIQRAVQAFVDEAGKESSRRRERLRLVLGFATDHFQKELRRHMNEGSQEATAAKRSRGCAKERLPGAERIIAKLDACLTALQHVDRNANLGLLVQSWSEKLACPS